MLCCEDGCPSALFRIFTAAFRSAWSAWPHVVQVNSRPHPGRDFGSTAPHAEQRCDVYGAGTTRISDPNFRALYPSCRRRSPGVLSRIERVQPGFLPDVPAGGFHGPSGGAGHAVHAEILDGDPTVVFGEVGGEFVRE